MEDCNIVFHWDTIRNFWKRLTSKLTQIYSLLLFISIFLDSSSRMEMENLSFSHLSPWNLVFLILVDNTPVLDYYRLHVWRSIYILSPDDQLECQYLFLLSLSRIFVLCQRKKEKVELINFLVWQFEKCLVDSNDEGSPKGRTSSWGNKVPNLCYFCF